MRKTILGAVAVAWGALILIHPFGGSPAHASSAYHAGASAATAFGAVLVVFGLFRLARALRRR